MRAVRICKKCKDLPTFSNKHLLISFHDYYSTMHFLCYHAKWSIFEIELW